MLTESLAKVHITAKPLRGPETVTVVPPQHTTTPPRPALPPPIAAPVEPAGLGCATASMLTACVADGGSAEIGEGAGPRPRSGGSRGVVLDPRRACRPGVM